MILCELIYNSNYDSNNETKEEDVRATYQPRQNVENASTILVWKAEEKILLGVLVVEDKMTSKRLKDTWHNGCRLD
jgi:hypothetical protein